MKLKNISSENIYFLISTNKGPTSDEVRSIRPVASDPITKINVEYEAKEQAESIKQNLYRNLIKKDSSRIIISSESAGIFVNSITISSIIRDRYNGIAHVFIIKETDLFNHSDHEITEKKIYRYFKSLTDKDVTEDTTFLEYMD